MKQVVVAVLDANGAYGWFKKIIAFIKLPPEVTVMTVIAEEKEKIKVEAIQ